MPVGYTIIALFGRNVAWTYHGRGAVCHGNVKLGYLVPWLALGTAVELLWSPVIVPASAAIAPHLWTLLLAAVPPTLLWSEDIGCRRRR